MIINLIKMNEKPIKVIHNGTLIDFAYDEFYSKNGSCHIFKASANMCSEQNLVAPEDKETFMSTDGEFTVIETPGDLITGIILVISLISIAIAAYILITMPDVSDSEAGQSNILGSRQNKERPLERIEDRAGRTRAYPTLIQQTYKKFEDKKTEVEYSLMCVSVGEGLIEDPKDTDTPIESIKNSGAMFYGPYKMASIDQPDVVFGESFNEPVEIVIRSNEVDGGIRLNYESNDSLLVPSIKVLKLSYSADGEVTFYISSTNIFSKNFLQFSAGDIINVDAITSQDSGYIDVSGQYQVTSSGINTMKVKAVGLADANTENPNWDLVPIYPDSVDADLYAYFEKDGVAENVIIGPYFLPRKNRTSFFANFSANGLQSDEDGTIEVKFGVQYAKANSKGEAIGPWSDIIPSSLKNNNRDRIGTTIRVETSFTGPCLVRALRTTRKIGGAAMQNVEWDSLYSVEPITVSDFGNVTTVQTRVVSNAGSTAAKTRKFNCMFTRKLNVINEDGTLGDFLPTRRFIDYMAYSTISDKIGRRSIGEINNLDMINRYNELVEYFGSEEAGYFDYAFDSDQVSFQSTLNAICDPCFSYPVRKSGVITYRSNLPGLPSTIFTHRNKIPNSQTITRFFESEEQKDGVEYQYVDPDSDEIKTITIPEDYVPSRPEKVESQGVRNHNQAWWNAQRRFNKIKYSRLTISDTFTSEGALLSSGDIVAITNNTKIKPQSGDVTDSFGLMLSLSEPVYFDDAEASYSIALRLRSGRTDVIPCDPGIMDNEVVLSRAPVEPVYTGYDEERTVFIFAKDETASANYYIIQDVNRDDLYQVPITGYNYTEKYFTNDGEESPYNEDSSNG